MLRYDESQLDDLVGVDCDHCYDPRQGVITGRATRGRSGGDSALRDGSRSSDESSPISRD